MPRLVLALVVAGLVLPSTPRAQDKPNFSGTWTMDRERSDAAKQAEPIGPVTIVIKQTDAELVVETRRADRTWTTTSRIHDSERASPALAGAPAARSYWQGTGLVTEIAGNVQGTTVTAKEIRSLDAGGNEMTVVTTLVIQHGYTLKGTQNYATGKDVYTKTIR